MAQSTRDAMMLNNLGAERFVGGDFVGALEAFRRALAYIPARANELEEALRSSVATQPSSLGIAFRSTNEDDNGNGNVAAIRKPPEDEPFVYQKPLIFNRLIPETQDGASAFCGVVVFNMALTFDMRSTIKTRSSRSGAGAAAAGTDDVNRTKALHLYRSCIDLFCKTSDRVDLTSAVAAACNNKARIYFEQSSFEDSNRELQLLQNCMRRADRSPTKKDFLEEEDFQGILLNLLLLWPPTVALAA